MDLYNHSPLRFQGLVRNYLSTRTILPFIFEYTRTVMQDGKPRTRRMDTVRTAVRVAALQSWTFIIPRI
jgi:hypothetical protein